MHADPVIWSGWYVVVTFNSETWLSSLTAPSIPITSKAAIRVTLQLVVLVRRWDEADLMMANPLSVLPEEEIALTIDPMTALVRVEVAVASVVDLEEVLGVEVLPAAL